MSAALLGSLVLASASAPRARLLAAAGVDAIIDPAAIDESEIKASFKRGGHDAADCAAALAEAKAAQVSRRHEGALVIGADQILVCDGIWLDKPRDRVEARGHLQFLRGKQHELLSAVAVLKDGAVLWHTVLRPRLTMLRFSDAFLTDYLARIGDAACASVGAYALEGLGVQLFTAIDGDYFSILGLPLLPLLDFLRARGALAT